MRYPKLKQLPLRVRRQAETQLGISSRTNDPAPSPSGDTGNGGIAWPAKRQAAKTGRSKMGATPTTRHGIRFGSKLEAQYFDYLRFLQAAGEVSYFLRQVPIELPARVTYRVDFMVVFTDGRLEYHEVKGHVTEVSRIKMKQAQALYPITLRVIRRGDFPILST